MRPRAIKAIEIAAGLAFAGGLLKIERRSLAGHLGDSGVAELGRIIRRARVRVGKFDDAEEAVAEAAIAFLDDDGEGANRAAAPDPAVAVAPGKGGKAGPSAERECETQPVRGVPEAVGGELEGAGKEKRTNGARDCDQRLHAPEPAFEEIELPGQRGGKWDRGLHFKKFEIRNSKFEKSAWRMTRMSVQNPRIRIKSAFRAPISSNFEFRISNFPLGQPGEFSCGPICREERQEGHRGVPLTPKGNPLFDRPWLGKQRDFSRTALRSAVRPAKPRLRAAMSRRMARLAGSPTCSRVEGWTLRSVSSCWLPDSFLTVMWRRPLPRGVYSPLKTPQPPGTGVEVQAFRGAGWRCNARGDVAFRNRETGLVKHGGQERDGVADARGFGRETEADALALGEVALVGHPADDLAPEAIMVFVLDAEAPAPGAIGAHEEDFAVAEWAGNEQRDSAFLVAQIRVDGQDLGARAGIAHGGAPVEAGEIFPDVGVGSGVSRPAW